MFISFLLAVYNGAEYLAAAIDSILHQSYTNFECIIINDGSTDESAAIIDSYSAKDNRIRVFHAPKNQGLIASLNWGVAEAKGDYIARLDADDIALPNRLAVQVAFLQQHPEVVLLGTGAEIIDSQGVYLQTNYYKKEQAAIRVHLLFHNIFVHSSIIAKTTVLREFPFDNADYLAEDYAVWIRIAQQYTVATIPTPLVQHRVHEQSITKVKYERHLQTVYHIFAQQLSLLHITPTPAQLALHWRIGAYQFGNDLAFYEAMGSWLWLLFEQNKELGVYPQPYFDSRLLQMWVDATLEVIPRGYTAYKVFVACPLTQQLPIPRRLHLIVRLLSRQRTFLR